MPSENLVVGTDSQMLRALDAHDGAVRWERRTGHPYGGLALARMADSVVAASLDGHLCVLRHDDGAVLWETTLSHVPGRVEEAGIRVAAAASSVAVQYGRRIVVVDATTGAAMWEYFIPTASRSGYLLEVGESHVYVVEQHLAARLSNPPWITTAFSLQTGLPAWSTSEHTAVEPAWDGGSSLVEADGVAYLYGNKLHALDAATGNVRWSQQDIPRFHVASMAVGTTHLAICLGSFFGAYRKDSGALLWSTSGRRGEDGYFEEFGAALELDAEGAIYVGRIGFNPDGFQLVAHDANSGTVRWTWPDEPAAARFGWRFRGAGGMLYIPAHGEVYCVRASDGHEIWRSRLDAASFALLALAA